MGGAPSEGGAESGAAGGSAPEEPSCGAPEFLRFLGTYVAPNGDGLWLRDSGKAVTIARVPAGRPEPTKPPRLWQVVSHCPDRSSLVLKTPAGEFTRLDYVEGASTLTVCIDDRTVTSVEEAERLSPADRRNTIDDGCNRGPWMHVVMEGR